MHSSFQHVKLEDGTEIAIDLDDDNCIRWCDHWEKIWDYVKQGIVKAIPLPRSYNDVCFYLKKPCAGQVI